MNKIFAIFNWGTLCGVCLMVLFCANSAKAYDMAIVAQGYQEYTGYNGYSERYICGGNSFDAGEICKFSVQKYDKPTFGKYKNFYSFYSTVKIIPCANIEITRIVIKDNSGGSALKTSGSSNGWNQTNVAKPTFTWTGNSQAEIDLKHTSSLRFDYVEISYRRVPTLTWQDVYCLKGESVGLEEPVYSGPSEKSESFSLTDEEGNDVTSDTVFINRRGGTQNQIVLTAPDEAGKTYKLTVTRGERTDPHYVPASATVDVKTYSKPTIDGYPDGVEPVVNGDGSIGDGTTVPYVYIDEGTYMVFCEYYPCTVYLHQAEGLPMKYMLQTESYSGSKAKAAGEYLDYDADQGIVLTNPLYGQVDFFATTPDGNNIGNQSAGFSIATGVNELGVDNTVETVEWYNLQGQPVTDPSSGIYIRKCGSRVEKVVR